jgi:hypothetical protein
MQRNLFHLGKNVIKKIVGMSLKVQYSSDQNLRWYGRALLALALLNELRAVFNFLRSRESFPIVLSVI